MAVLVTRSLPLTLASQAQPLPKRVAPALLKASLNLSKEPKAESMPLASSPLGSPPPGQPHTCRACEA